MPVPGERGVPFASRSKTWRYTGLPGRIAAARPMRVRDRQREQDTQNKGETEKGAE